MKFPIRILILLSFSFCASDGPTESFNYEEPVEGDTTASGNLIWADEFNSNGTINESNWTYDIGRGSDGWGNNEVQYYTNEEKNVRIENGILVIEALKKNGKWTSARIKTEGKQSFKHVSVKVRAKLPAGAGTWPAIWMLGSNFAEVGWPASGEIDIMEHVGKDPGLVHSSLHTPSSFGNTQNTASAEVPEFSESFHIYEANWTSNRITFKVDGEAFYTYEPSTKNDETWPYNNEFFIIMNVAMGGNWGSDAQYETGGFKNGIDPSLIRARMEVDYIRVYAN